MFRIPTFDLGIVPIASNSGHLLHVSASLLEIISQWLTNCAFPTALTNGWMWRISIGSVAMSSSACSSKMVA